jgi:hypothetical protein
MDLLSSGAMRILVLGSKCLGVMDCPATATPTPPPNRRPQINVAGYLDTDLKVGIQGTLTLLAWVTDPEGDALDSVEIYLGGPTGVTLQDSGGGVFQFSVPATFAAPISQLLLELKATDGRGAESTLWPYLTILPGSAPAPPVEGAWGSRAEVPEITWSTEAMLSMIEGRRWRERPAIGGGLFVMAAGYMNTEVYFQTGGDLTLLAWAKDLGGSVDSVELYFGGRGTGFFLSGGPEIFQFSTHLGPQALPAGTYTLELRAHGASGDSPLWPYFQVSP